MRAGARNIASRVLHPDVTPSGLGAGYERGDGVVGLALWDPGGTLAVAETSYGLSVDNFGGPYWAVPATQWSITTKIVLPAPNTAYQIGAIVVAEDLEANPTTANYVVFVLQFAGTAEPQIEIQRWSQYGSFTGYTAQFPTGLGFTGSVYMRVTSNGVAPIASWSLLVSADGIGWFQLATGTWAHLSGVVHRGVIVGGANSAAFPFVRNRSGASEYLAHHIEGGIIT